MKVLMTSAADIATCQKNGKKILLSIGGAATNGVFTAESQGTAYAQLLWDMFLGGGNAAVPRPFGTSVLDGFDFDIEGGSYIGWGSLVNGLRALYATDSSKTYYISGLVFYNPTV